MTIHNRGKELLPLVAFLLTVAIIAYSEAAFQAALDGLRIWWEVVFPALLPFFIMAQILMGMGVVHFFGTLLEPLMRPLFRVPGEGAFAMAMGLAAGYPLGAKITGDLCRKQICTTMEGERLVSFTNTADPLFMVGAVAVGFYGDARLGLTLSAAHYLACLAVGFCLRFHGHQQEKGLQEIRKREAYSSNIIIRSLQAQKKAYQQDGRSLGELMGAAVKDGVNDLLLIGGFIILFSVFTSILSSLGIVRLVSHIFAFLLHPTGLDQSLILPLFSGLFEITIGSNLASQSTAPLLQKMMITSGLIAWSGFSVHAQVAAMIKNTGIKMKPYLLARVLHAMLALFFTLILMAGFSPLSSLPLMPLPVVGIHSLQLTLTYSSYLLLMVRKVLTLLFFLTTASLFIYLLGRLKLVLSWF